MVKLKPEAPQVEIKYANDPKKNEWRITVKIPAGSLGPKSSFKIVNMVHLIANLLWAAIGASRIRIIGGDVDVH